MAVRARGLAEMSWRAVVRVLRSPAGLLDDMVTTVFPADCRCCGGPLLRANPVPVCDVCVGRVERSRMASCGCCGEALDLDLNLSDNLEDARFAGQMAEALRCRVCRMAEPAFARAVSYASYEEELRMLIGLLKFDGLRVLAEILGDRLADAVLQLEGSTGFAARPELLVVAVPLFAGRERQRGYNQSVLLAERAMKRLGRLRPEWRLTASHAVLRRVRQTAAQFELGKRERRRNLRGAFAVREGAAELLRGREVLLVDDIMTSGATARECARVLRRAGAAKVWVATVARAQKQEFARVREDPGEGVFARWGSQGDF